jgi:Restriction endonuclease
MRSYEFSLRLNREVTAPQSIGATRAIAVVLALYLRELLPRYGIGVSAAAPASSGDSGHDLRVSLFGRSGASGPVELLVQVKAYGRGRVSVSEIQHLSELVRQRGGDTGGLLVTNTPTTCSGQPPACPNGAQHDYTGPAVHDDPDAGRPGRCRERPHRAMRDR